MFTNVNKQLINLENLTKLHPQIDELRKCMESEVVCSLAVDFLQGILLIIKNCMQKISSA